MTLAHSLSLYSPGVPSMRRSGWAEIEADEAAQSPADDDTKPRWQIPLYQQPARPSQAAIAAYQRSLAAERALDVPHGINLLQQAEAVMEANDDLRHCNSCDAPIEAAACQCPYCHWEG